MKWLIAIALLVAACAPAADSRGPSGAVLAATGQPASTPDPCRTAVTGLAAFTDQLSADVGDIKEPLTAKPFVAADAAVASFRVSAMLTSFRLDELVAALQACPATTDLGPRVTRLVAAMNKVLDEARSASISNAQAQRAAAAALVGMLPDVTALAKANDLAAATIGAARRPERPATGRPMRTPISRAPSRPTPRPAPPRRILRVWPRPRPASPRRSPRAGSSRRP